MSGYDLLVKGARVVVPSADAPVKIDVAVKDGVFIAIGDGLSEKDAARVVDARDRYLFPGAVDVHQHWGIYSDLRADALTESKASAQGGVTTGISYVRTGSNYLETTGAYRDVFPKFLDAAAGNSYIDYGFHLAPILSEHIDEIPDLVENQGVSSFKIFMFYGNYGLHGHSDDQRSFLMLPEGDTYDLAHFEFIMRKLSSIYRDERFRAFRDFLSLSLHCETAEIMRAYTKLVAADPSLSGLEAYSASRPPHSEALAITIAAYLASETEFPNINLLHLSSKKAIEAAMLMQSTFPHINFRREVTIGHLLVGYETAGIGGKVNPPLRSAADIEALWEHLLAGNISWVASDHACCSAEHKFGADKDDVFAAKSGFGGTEYLLPGLITAGRKRGLSYNRVAQLVSKNPAERFGLRSKGDVAVGYDADFCLVDDTVDYTVRASDSPSSQGHTPFEGLTMTARVTDTFLRGQAIWADGAPAGTPLGRYLRRPTGVAGGA